MPKVTINKWDGGIENDPRNPREDIARTSTGFDSITNPRKLTPYRDSEDGDSAGNTSKKVNFTIGLWTPTGNYRLFSLGKQSGNSRAEVLMKDLTTGASNDLDDNTWATPANNTSSSGAFDEEMFIYYPKTAKIYGMQGSRYVYEFTPDGSTGWNDTKYDYGSTASSISEAIIHSGDGTMYFGIDNKVIVNDNGTFSVGYTIDPRFKIVSVAEYGNYLAVNAVSKSGVENSVVLLWNRDISITVASEAIDFGEGDLKVVGQIGGALVGITLSGNSTTRFKNRVIFKYYEGGAPEAIKIKELILDSDGTTQLVTANQKVDTRLYFMMMGLIDGVQRDGVWSITRLPDGTFSINHERTPNNDTALSGGVLYYFQFVGDYLFQAYLTSSTHDVSKTNDAESYTATSYRHTCINPKMPLEDRRKNKDLRAVSLSTEPLPTNGQVVLKYRVDGGAWTTIFTETEDSSILTERDRSSGDNFSSGCEYEFAIESTGGAVVTDFTYHYEVLPTLL